MQTYHLFPFYDDESATVLSEPILTIETDGPPDDLTDSMLREMLLNLGSQPADVDGLSFYEMADLVYTAHGLRLDSCAVIPAGDNVLEFLEEVGTAVMDGCGSDSCWYRASAVFSQILKNKAAVVIDFPYPSEEAFE